MTRPPNSRFTYGLGRLEDLAGIAIVVAMLASAGLVVGESVQRLLNPREIDHLPLLVAASMIGFLGNEAVAIYKMRVGRRVGSAALIASARHARADGLTSLAVGGGAIGIALGFPVADPIVGLVIAIPILFMALNSGASVWKRLLDGVEAGLPERLSAAAAAVSGAQAIRDIRVRWVGHALYVEVCVVVDEDLPTRESHRIAEEVKHALFHAHPALGKATVHVDPCGHSGIEPHAATLHHEQETPTGSSPAVSPALP
jgi:cation diffusion facilitator family transporter